MDEEHRTLGFNPNDPGAWEPDEPRVSIEDCIAMSEDGDWYAFRRDGSTSRPQIMAAVCRDGEEHGAAWFEILEAFRGVRVGWVTESEENPGIGWWSECDHDTPGAVPAWIVERKP
jgi:hypothetical protein